MISSCSSRVSWLRDKASCNVATFKLTLAYDGTDFVGWQRQATGVSIQGLIEEALAALDGREVAVAGAGRTDAGVHALGQVASFALQRSIEPATVARALNARLPPAVRVVAVEKVRDDFHARFSAVSKTYLYRICTAPAISPFDRHFVWHLPGPLDLEAMADAARRLEGVHDFAAFQAAGSEAKRTVRRVTRSKLSTTEDTEEQRSGLRVPRVLRGGELIYSVTGDGFLRHMVRAIVGSLVDVGRGRHPAGWIDDVIASRDRRRAGRTAPAHGLALASVEYRALADEP